MTELKGNWDRLPTPPEEMKRITGPLKWIFIFLVVLPLILGISGAIIYFTVFRDDTMLMISGALIMIGAIIMTPAGILLYFLSNKKYHHAVKLQLKRNEVEYIKKMVGSFLLDNGIHHTFESPGKYAYRGYAFPPDAGIYIKPELFIGIARIMGNNNVMRWQLWIYYLPTIWEEALILQQDLDRFLFDQGLSKPIEKGKKLTLF